MAAKLALLSLNNTQPQSQSHRSQQQQQQQQQQKLNPCYSTHCHSWMWKVNKQEGAGQEEEESWEVRAFAEDTGSIMGTTWPPRSYTCTFCRREFRSAQALGGHMNVHRRDRARLHQPNNNIPTAAAATTSSSSSSSAAFIIPTHHQELVANAAGLCLLYSLPSAASPNTITTTPLLSPTAMTACVDSPYSHAAFLPQCPQSINFPVLPLPPPPPLPPTDSSSSNNHIKNNCIRTKTESEWAASEDLDLELRLGCSSSPP